MSDTGKKISSLTAVSSVGTNDFMVVNPDGGNTSKVTAGNLADSINLADTGAGTSLVYSQSGLTKALKTVDAGAGMSITEAGGVLTFTAAGGITNRVVVESKSDLPTPAGGIITLVANTEYLVAGAVALGTDYLDASAGNIVIRGNNPVSASISYTGTTPMIVKVGASPLFIENILISCGSADVIDDDSAGTGSLEFESVIFGSIKRVGTIDRTANFKMLRCGFLGTTTTKAIEFTGACARARIEQSDFGSFTGTAIDLGTATFDYVSVTGNYFAGGASNVALSGAASGANINAKGRLVVENNYIDPDFTTPISTITADDDKVTFFGNTSVRNSEVYGGMYISTAGTTTISGASTPVKVGDGATVVWSDDDSGRLTFANSGRYTYSDSIDEKVNVSCTAVLSNLGAGTNTYRLYIAKNGTVNANSYQPIAVTAGTNSNPVTVTSLETISDTDYLELWVSNETDTDDVQVVNAYFRVN